MWLSHTSMRKAGSLLAWAVLLAAVLSADAQRDALDADHGLRALAQLARRSVVAAKMGEVVEVVEVVEELLQSRPPPTTVCDLTGGTCVKDDLVHWLALLIGDLTVSYPAEQLYGKPPPAPNVSAPSKQRAKVLVPAIVVPSVVVLLLLLTVAGFAYVRARKRFKRFFRTVLPPGVSPATSLLVTDISDSTSMWEALSPTVMDEALRIHHETIRGKLVKYRGYESCTEGDSFIIAFHTSQDAINFCIAVQAALMQAPWPDELLDSEYACEAWVSCNTRALLQHKAPGPAPGMAGAGGVRGSAPQQHVGLSAGSMAQLLYANASAGGGGYGYGGLGAVSNPGMPYYAGLGSDRASALQQQLTQAQHTLGGSNNICLSRLALDLLHACAAATLPSLAVTAATGAMAQAVSTGRELLSRLQQDEYGPGDDAPAFGRGSDGGYGGAGEGAMGPLVTQASGDFNNPNPDPSVRLGLFGLRSRPGTPHKGSFRRSSLGQTQLGLPPDGGGPPSPKGGTSGGATNSGLNHPLPTSSLLHHQQQQTVSSVRERHMDADDMAMNSAALVGIAGAVRAQTVGQALSGLMQSPTGQPDPEAGPGEVPVLAFKGLRVRMGVSSGLTSAAAVSHNAASGRVQYSGELAQTAKKVSDAASGGMILISESCLAQLQHQALASSCFILHMGQHVLDYGQRKPVPLIQVLPRPLAVRLPFFTPLRSLGQVSKDVLAAPAGWVSIGFMHVAGASSLMAWDMTLAQEAFALYQKVVISQLSAVNGYLVECADGLILASFTDASDALVWALASKAALMQQEWSEDLLEHELCEEVSVMAAAGALAGTAGSLAGAPSTVGGGTGVLNERASLPMAASAFASAAAYASAVGIGSAYGAAASANSALSGLGTGGLARMFGHGSAVPAVYSGPAAPVAEPSEAQLNPYPLAASSMPPGGGSARSVLAAAMAAGMPVMQGTPSAPQVLVQPQQGAGLSQPQQPSPMAPMSQSNSRGSLGHTLSARGMSATGMLVATMSGTLVGVGPGRGDGTSAGGMGSSTGGLGAGMRQVSLKGGLPQRLAAAAGGAHSPTYVNALQRSAAGTAENTPANAGPGYGAAPAVPSAAAAGAGAAPLARDSAAVSGAMAEPPPLIKQVLMKGPRIKVGIDSGFCIDGIHMTTGQISYRGKVMNRAARISNQATAGQVLCSSAVWKTAKRNRVIRRAGITGSSMGKHTLKGIHEQMELYTCTASMVNGPLANAARESVVSQHSTPGGTANGDAGGPPALSLIPLGAGMHPLERALSLGRSRQASLVGSQMPSRLSLCLDTTPSPRMGFGAGSFLGGGFGGGSNTGTGILGMGGMGSAGMGMGSVGGYADHQRYTDGLGGTGEMGAAPCTSSPRMLNTGGAMAAGDMDSTVLPMVQYEDQQMSGSLALPTFSAIQHAFGSNTLPAINNSEASHGHADLIGQGQRLSAGQQQRQLMMRPYGDPSGFGAPVGEVGGSASNGCELPPQDTGMVVESIDAPRGSDEANAEGCTNQRFMMLSGGDAELDGVDQADSTYQRGNSSGWFGSTIPAYETMMSTTSLRDLRSLGTGATVSAGPTLTSPRGTLTAHAAAASLVPAGGLGSGSSGEPSSGNGIRYQDMGGGSAGNSGMVGAVGVHGSGGRRGSAEGYLMLSGMGSGINSAAAAALNAAQQARALALAQSMGRSGGSRGSSGYGMLPSALPALHTLEEGHSEHSHSELMRVPESRESGSSPGQSRHASDANRQQLERGTVAMSASDGADAGGAVASKASGQQPTQQQAVAGQASHGAPPVALLPLPPLPTPAASSGPGSGSLPLPIPNPQSAGTLSPTAASTLMLTTAGAAPVAAAGNPASASGLVVPPPDLSPTPSTSAGGPRSPRAHTAVGAAPRRPSRLQLSSSIAEGGVGSPNASANGNNGAANFSISVDVATGISAVAFVSAAASGSSAAGSAGQGFGAGGFGEIGDGRSHSFEGHSSLTGQPALQSGTGSRSVARLARRSLAADEPLAAERPSSTGSGNNSGRGGEKFTGSMV